MRSVLIPVDGLAGSDSAVRAAIARTRDGSIDAIHLLSVQAPLTAYSSQFLNGRVVRDFQRERGEQALGPARRRLDAAKTPYTAHIRLGEAASTIAEVARELRAGEILLGLDGEAGFLKNLSLWLDVNRIRRHATVPVTVTMAPPRPLAPAFDPAALAR